MKMKKLPPEAKRGRATDRVKEGYENARRGAIATNPKMQSHSAWTERGGVKTSPKRGNA
jgi:hypothetical protein